MFNPTWGDIRLWYSELHYQARWQDTNIDWCSTCREMGLELSFFIQNHYTLGIKWFSTWNTYYHEEALKAKYIVLKPIYDRPPFPKRHTHSQVLVFQPGADARGELCSVHIVLSCYINLYFSFIHIVWPLTTPPPYSPPPPYPCQPPSPPPLPAPLSSPTLCIGIYRTNPITIMTPVLPDIVLPPYIDPVLDKSRYTGGWCSGIGLNMYPPALSPPPTLLHPYGGYY